MNLYLKYRPRTIDELDLAGVRKALSDIVASNKTSHAYLLTGPRGAGKTSTARILARIVNCEKNGRQLGEPCNKCSACTSILDGSAMDVIEIDAASNRGIDDIRELKEKIRLSPVSLPKKVYIIDEVHMLTSEAFNALLKTLEEPPKNALFILCTTETHKVPETIVSRCTRIAFTKATPEEMVRSFARVAKGEEVETAEDALLYLASSVDGSFRDGVKILDQIIAKTRNVLLKDVQEAISGVVGYTSVPLAQALVQRDGASALTAFRTAISGGVDLTYLLVSVMKNLRDSLLSAYGMAENPLSVSAPADTARLVVLIDETCRKIALSSVPTLLVEMLIIEWCSSSDNQSTQRISKSENQQTSKSEKIASKNQSAPVAQAVEASAPAEEIVSHEVVSVTMDAREIWQKILGSLGQYSMALDTILSKARPGAISGDELTVYVAYDFHKQQLMSEKNRAKFEEILTLAVGRPMKVVCEVGASSLTTQPQVSVKEGDIIDEAMAIFS